METVTISALARLLAVTFVLTATSCRCDRGESAPGDQPRPATAPSAATGAQGTAPGLSIDSEPVAVASVLAVETDARSLLLVAATRPLECAQVRRLRADPLPGEVMRLTLTRTLERDGPPRWRVRTALFDGGMHTGLTNPVELTQGGGTLSARFQFEVRGASQPDQEFHTLGHDGELVARFCRPKEGTPAPVPWTGPGFEIAGEQLAIRGASLVKRDEDLTLWLATDPHACGVSPVQSDVALSLTLEGEPLRVRETTMRGRLLASQLTGGAEEAAGLTVTLAPTAAKLTRITLAGELKVVGYPVKIDTTVEARTCDK